MFYLLGSGIASAASKKETSSYYSVNSQIAASAFSSELIETEANSAIFSQTTIVYHIALKVFIPHSYYVFCLSIY